MAGPRSISCQTRSSADALSSASPARRRDAAGPRRRPAIGSTSGEQTVLPAELGRGRLHAGHRRRARDRCRRPRPGGGELGRGSRMPRPGTRPARRRTPRARRRIAIDRSANAQAALEPVLGDHDRRVEVLVEPAQQPDQLVAGDRVELRGRLVEHDQLRPAGQRRPERHALELAAGELGASERSSRWAIAERQRHLLDGPRDRRRRLAAVLQRNASSARTVPITTCVSGSWNSVPTATASAAGAVLARVHAGDDRAARRTRRRGSAGTSPLARAAASTCPSPTRRRATTSSPGPISSDTSSSAGPPRPGRSTSRARARGRSLDPLSVRERQQRAGEQPSRENHTADPDRRVQRRVRLETRPPRDSSGDGQYRDHHRGGGESQVVPRPRPALIPAARPGTAGWAGRGEQDGKVYARNRWGAGPGLAGPGAQPGPGRVRIPKSACVTEQPAITLPPARPHDRDAAAAADRRDVTEHPFLHALDNHLVAR